MEGNRQHTIRFGKISHERGLTDQGSHAGHAVQAAAEFQGKDGRGDRWLIEKQGTGKIKAIPMIKAITAEMVATTGKRNTAERAAGGTDIGNCGKTAGTEERRP